MNFKTFLPHLIAVLVFVAVSAFYFSPQFAGKVLHGGDITSYRGMAEEANAYKRATGESALWTNSMFGGMPTYQINRISQGNELSVFKKVLFFFQRPPFGTFLAGMIGFYLMAVLLGVNHWLAAIGALAFGTATNDFVLYDAGHASKVEVIAYFPIIAAGLILAFRKKYVIGGLVFGIGMGMNLLANHPQMTFYFGMTILIYGFAQLFTAIKEKELPHFFKASGALLVGLLLGLGSGASNLLPTLEYAKDTMRGKQILTPAPATTAGATSKVSSGLEWDYAMQWSNGTKDLLTVLIPYAAGSGPATEVTSDSPFGEAVRQIGGRAPAKVQLPLYHGDLGFTAGPAYLGAVLWLLFFIGLLTVKGPAKWWLAGGVLLTMMLSMGKNLAFFNHLLFDYLPMFNKFRAPNSVLSITDFLMAALAVLGMQQVYSAVKEDRINDVKMPVLIAGAITGGFTLLMWLVGPSLFDFAGPRDAAYAGQFLGQTATPQQIATMSEGFVNTRISIFKSDALRTLLFIGLSLGVLVLYLRKNISMAIMAAALCVLTVADFGGITNRYYSKDKWKTPRQENNKFAPNAADQQILADTDPYYRVFNTTVGDPFQDAMTSFLHKSVGGYNAAKLQRYNDLINYHLRRGNQAVFNMMNTKYYIQQGQNGQPVAVQNPAALGNAWLVNTVQTVNTPNEEIEALGEGFNPATTAVVHKDFSDQLAGLTPTGEGSISLQSYSPMELRFTSNSSSEQLAVFSDIWYGPNKGWTATIDGKETDILRANYVLRALRLPAGSHEIVFAYAPATYSTGVILSYICSILLLGGVLFLLFRAFKDGQFTATKEELIIDQPIAEVPKRRAPKKKK